MDMNLGSGRAQSFHQVPTGIHGSETHALLSGSKLVCCEGDQQEGNVSSTVVSEEVGCYPNTKDEKGFFMDGSLPLLSAENVFSLKKYLKARDFVVD